MAEFQALPTLFAYRYGGTYPPCQYRAFLDGEYFTFSEDDWFVGGSVIFSEYDQLVGPTRADAIADLGTYDARLWLSEISPDGQVGTPIEQTLMETPYKDLGGVVYKEFGVLLQLAPGDYLSTFQDVLPGEVYVSEVTLHVVPAA